MSLAWILLALAALLTGIAIYELHVSCEAKALADRLAAAMDGCQTVWVHITWCGPGAGGASHGSCTQQI